MLTPDQLRVEIPNYFMKNIILKNRKEVENEIKKMEVIEIIIKEIAEKLIIGNASENNIDITSVRQ